MYITIINITHIKLISYFVLCIVYFLIVPGTFQVPSINCKLIVVFFLVCIVEEAINICKYFPMDNSAHVFAKMCGLLKSTLNGREFCDFISLSSMKERSKHETVYAINLAGAHLHYNAGIYMYMRVYMIHMHCIVRCVSAAIWN